MSKDIERYLPGSKTTSAGSDELYALAIGDQNRHYYLPRFEAFEGAGATSLGWHWPAFFFTFWWLIYRKMWGMAALYLVLPYGLLLALAPLATVSEAAAGVGYLVYTLAIFVVPPLIATRRYYRHCQRLIGKAKATSSNPYVQVALLTSKGGTSNFALVILGAVVAFVGMLAAAAISEYRDYTVRQKAVNALLYGKDVAAAVGKHYETQRAFPRNLGDVGYPPPLPWALDDAQLNTASGVLQFTLSNGPASGRTFQLVPSLDAGGKVSWKCQTVNMKKSLQIGRAHV